MTRGRAAVRNGDPLVPPTYPWQENDGNSSDRPRTLVQVIWRSSMPCV